MKPGSSRISQIFREENAKGTDKKAIMLKKSTSSIRSESGFHHAIEALLSLENASVIFMQRLLDYEEIQAAGIRFHEDTVDLAYQILNVQGTLLFLMEQHKIKCSAFIVYTKRSFENILYDVHGTVVLKFVGPSVIMSRMVSRMTITDNDDRLLGYVKEFGKRVNYSVYNARGERLFLVVSNSYIPSSSTPFSILYRGQNIGVIKFGWKHVYHDLPYIDYETTGVEFPADMDEREKALLIGCMMLIEFSWYSPLTKLRLSMLLVGLILASLGIIVIFFPFFVESTTQDPETASFFKVQRR
ncbi:Phospholipid scramblase 2 [Orchesella cincta]|uniref:Phospholipid scramblase n=1 Tax=Orchesella cincta TaxID=48709 RepID=A0A1D2N1H0_ORCCI|nr:Phospholipid scramblase 2 [Orchesella cincta]